MGRLGGNAIIPWLQTFTVTENFKLPKHCTFNTVTVASGVGIYFSWAIPNNGICVKNVFNGRWPLPAGI